MRYPFDLVPGLTFQVSGGGGPPPGTYPAMLERITPTEHSEYGLGLRFEFKIYEGPFMGMTASRTTSREPSPINAAGKLMAGLLDRQIQPGERVSLGECIGQRYTITVAPNASGSFTRVERCERRS